MADQHIIHRVSQAKARQDQRRTANGAGQPHEEPDRASEHVAQDHLFAEGDAPPQPFDVFKQYPPSPARRLGAHQGGRRLRQRRPGTEHGSAAGHDSQRRADSQRRGKREAGHSVRKGVGSGQKAHDDRRQGPARAGKADHQAQRGQQHAVARVVKEQLGLRVAQREHPADLQALAFHQPVHRGPGDQGRDQEENQGENSAHGPDLLRLLHGHLDAEHISAPDDHGLRAVCQRLDGGPDRPFFRLRGKRQGDFGIGQKIQRIADDIGKAHLAGGGGQLIPLAGYDIFRHQAKACDKQFQLPVAKREADGIAGLQAVRAGETLAQHALIPPEREAALP